jgi:hypothetical protein
VSTLVPGGRADQPRLGRSDLGRRACGGVSAAGAFRLAAARRQVHRASALTNLGLALLAQGKRPEAIETYAVAVSDWQELEVPEGLIWCLEGLALAATDSNAAVAARIGGALARACDELGYVLPDLEQHWHDRRVSAVAAELDPARISSLEEEGRVMGLDEAVGYAVASVH